MKTELFGTILFLMLAFSLSATAESCIIGLESTSTIKECLTDQDLNFLELVTFEGQKSFDFDVNITITRESDKAELTTDADMNQTSRTGIYFFSVSGGYADPGEYSLIINAEHLTGGSPDGNVGAATYSFTLVDSNIHGLISSVQSTVDAIDVASSTPEVCAVKLNTTFYLGQYLFLTLSGFDTNGNQLTDANFDVFRGNEKIVNSRNMINKTDFLQFVFPEKFNNDIYTLIIRSGDCILTRFCTNLNEYCY